MDYQTYEPSENLNPIVKCYWTLENPKADSPERQTIVPDGCLEMIFHYGDLYKQFLDDGQSIIQPRCFIFGQLTKPLEIEPTGEIGIFSVRFHPDTFLSLTTIPIKEMENTAVSLEKIFGKAGQEIEQIILNSNSALERISHIETFLLKQLRNTETIDNVIKSTVDIILTANGQYSVEELTKQIGINRRQLERKFSTAVGLSPKQLSRIIRLQATLKMLMNNKFTSLTALAYEAEYYDQAHFIKDFKELTGYTPKDFYGDNLKMSFLFYGTE